MAIDPSSPYLKVPPTARWREAMAGRVSNGIDPHAESRLCLKPGDRVASAGSCFAQRISEALRKARYNYMVVEDGPPFLSDDARRAMGYGVYSARYGNVYTALQLVQLFRRAFGLMQPQEPLWRTHEGGYVDPFRPAVQPGGFATENECLWDRAFHLNAVQKVFREMDVFIFTLGLTEAWQSAADGAVFPICPGSGLGGLYDPKRHVFHNFTVTEVVSHLATFVKDLEEVNPSAKIILTVSPVPLIATFEPRHVLQATVYSKSVLRVACEEIVQLFPHVHYFASYEIVTATGDSKSYFLDDRRTVSDSAVAHVIECFSRQFMSSSECPASWQAAGGSDAHVEVQAECAEPSSDTPMCDEELVIAALAEKLGQESGR